MDAIECRAGSITTIIRDSRNPGEHRKSGAGLDAGRLNRPAHVNLGNGSIGVVARCRTVQGQGNTSAGQLAPSLNSKWRGIQSMGTRFPHSDAKRRPIPAAQ